MHELQTLFATQEGEIAWEAELRQSFHEGDLENLRKYLAMSLEALDTPLAQQCLSTNVRSIEFNGWDELTEAVEIHEGEPITGVTIAIANDPDTAFGKGEEHRPYMLLGIYGDEPYAFSKASAAQMIAEAGAEEGPAWAGYDADIEVFLECEGLDALNTALVFHKERHFFRDEAPDHAPRRYVEYVLACWWRALLFHEAVQHTSRSRPLPGGIPVLAGMVDMRPEVMMVHGIEWRATLGSAAEALAGAEMPEMLPSSVITRKEVVEEKAPTGLDLRRRVAESEPEEEAAPQKKSLMGRLFGKD
ncbi:hypothetical protein [Qipengyuania aquimaris]|uniref:Uncharacterized protein n=1 Tax=Qipengyuania aquimaris TaxID=255984 RepID=A0A9Q3XBU4_9SPHN|nr:hypothetical protein [Qipengyuania aquimaris]MBY6216804.1 hypothetical protein [Qipengyuania aquimaris]